MTIREPSGDLSMSDFQSKSEADGVALLLEEEWVYERVTMV